MPAFVYHRPDTVEEALALIVEHGAEAKVLAGGQSLLPLLALRLVHPGHLVDLGRIDELTAIAEEIDGAVVVGASVRQAEVEGSALVAARSPLLAAAVPFIGHRAIRNWGTVCGSMAHADPAAELPAVAVAADAEMVVRGVSGERRVAARDFFLGYLTSVLGEDELLAAVRFPPWRASAGWSVQEQSRRHGDFALVGVAAVLEVGGAGDVERAALSFFGAGSTPLRVEAAEELLLGQRPSPAVFAEAGKIVAAELLPPDDNHASGAYRSHVAGVLTRRALAEAAKHAGEAA